MIAKPSTPSELGLFLVVLGHLAIRDHRNSICIWIVFGVCRMAGLDFHAHVSVIRLRFLSRLADARSLEPRIAVQLWCHIRLNAEVLLCGTLFLSDIDERENTSLLDQLLMRAICQ